MQIGTLGMEKLEQKSCTAVGEEKKMKSKDVEGSFAGNDVCSMSENAFNVQFSACAVVTSSDEGARLRLTKIFNSG